MKLHNQIVEFLTALPNIQDATGQQALIYSAALDGKLKNQIEFGGSPAQFCQVLVETLARYGRLEDGRLALVAILEAAKERVGQEGQKRCDELIQQVPKPIPAKTPQPPQGVHVDWGEAPDVSVFFGRTKELETLEQWILTDRCRLVPILGSCVVLTSREKPQEISGLEGKTKPVRVLELSGLDPDDGRKLFEEIGDFSCSPEEWNTLVAFYHGNPLALELAARHIHEVFFGDISAFFHEGRTVFADLRG